MRFWVIQLTDSLEAIHSMPLQLARKVAEDSEGTPSNPYRFPPRLTTSCIGTSVLPRSVRPLSSLFASCTHCHFTALYRTVIPPISEPSAPATPDAAVLACEHRTGGR
jgi:hypothetical protein